MENISIDVNKPEDLATFETLKEIANSITKQIQFEVDVPSNYENQKVPYLDLNIGIVDNNKVTHVFYKKKMAHKKTLMLRSAVSMKVKRETIFNEIMRRIRNTSPDQEWKVKADTLSIFMDSLKKSGYNELYRFNVLKGALERMDTFEKQIKDKIIKRYRTRSEIKEMKKLKAGRTNQSFFLRGNVVDTLEVSHTEKGELAQLMRNKLKTIQKPEEGQTQVIERSGRSMMSGLRKEFPHKLPGCDRQVKCSVDPKYNCSAMNVTYKVTCKLCPDNDTADNTRGVYLGCTGRSVHVRALEHEDDARDDKQKNAISKHIYNNHPDADLTTPDLMKVTVVASHTKTLTRVIDEGIRLEHNSNLANSKGEWGRGGGLVRLVPIRSQDREVNLENRSNLPVSDEQMDDERSNNSTESQNRHERQWREGNINSSDNPRLRSQRMEHYIEDPD